MNRVPTGTVTFLFSDIEGSTRSWEHQANQMLLAFKRQEEIMRSAMENHGGYVYKMIGDAFQVAFDSAPAALAAAMQAQQALLAEPWGETTAIKVRMALHTGETEERGDDYVGPLLNRVARLMSAGHGGQILLTRATAELVHDHLPDGTWLHDLGKHRLKDLERPENVFQLAAPGLQFEFPALNTLDARPHNLPVQLTSFVGRESELSEVQSLLGKTRLLTLTGPGGVGKTRLALQAAAHCIENYPDGVFFVPLAAVTSPNFLTQVIAGAIRFSLENFISSRHPNDILMDYLRNRSLLLVLDNFEHLVAGAGLLDKLLTGAPDIHLLITSRERLKLQGEWIYEVEGLSYPTNGSTAGLEDYCAVKLFLDRARQIESRLILSDEEKPCVKRICQLVQGMPLGIELAAAWLPVLTCQEIAEEIENNLNFLASTQRGLPDKHRSLRATFDYSWRLLDDETRHVFRCLSIFQGGFDRKSAQQILTVDLLILSELVDKSFLRRDEHGRYEIHELLRQYGQEKLSDYPQEEREVRERHSRYYVEFLTSRKAALFSEQLIQVRGQVRLEYENIRSAIYWAIINWETTDTVEALDAYNIFYLAHGWHEGCDAFLELINFTKAYHTNDQVYFNVRINFTTFATLLSRDQEAEKICQEDLATLRERNMPSELGICLVSLGVIACEYYGKYEESQELLLEAVSLLRKCHQDFFFGYALMWLGYTFYLQGDYENAKAWLEESYTTYQQVHDLYGACFTLSKLGLVADALHDYPLARQYHLDAGEILSRFGDRAGEGYTTSRLSVTAYGEGNYSEAVQLGREGLEKFSEIGHVWGIGASHCRIGFALLELGELEQAAEHFLDALKLAQDIQHIPLQLYALVGIGNLLALQNQLERAVKLLTFVQTHPRTPSPYHELAEMRLPDLKATLPVDAFRSAQEHGKSSTIEMMVNIAFTALS
jgi:predicted ATPase/class 3 adenylate cyclase